MSWERLLACAPTAILENDERSVTDGNFDRAVLSYRTPLTSELASVCGASTVWLARTT